MHIIQAMAMPQAAPKSMHYNTIWDVNLYVIPWTLTRFYTTPVIIFCAHAITYNLLQIRL